MLRGELEEPFKPETLGFQSRGSARRGLAHAVPDPAIEVFDQFFEYLELALEVQVEGALADPGLFRDANDRRLGVSDLGEYCFCRFEYSHASRSATGGSGGAVHRVTFFALSVLQRSSRTRRSTFAPAERGISVTNRTERGTLKLAS